ncbi:MAG: hypothetical protein ABW185_13095 [Sedimenticola sp.]
MSSNQEHLLLSAVTDPDFRQAEAALCQWIKTPKPLMLETLRELSPLQLQRLGYVVDMITRRGWVPRQSQKDLLAYLSPHQAHPKALTLEQQWQTDQIFSPGRLSQRLRENEKLAGF